MRSRLIILLITAILLSGCADRNNPVRIGFSAMLSGPGGTPSTIVRNGAVLAVEKINAAGGINGRPVELIIKDDRGDPETALRVDQELYEAGVEAIIGHTNSLMSAAVLDFINEKELLMLSPTSSAEFLMGKDDYFFSLYPSNRRLAVTAAEFAYHQLGLRKLNTIIDTFNAIYSENYFTRFSEHFETIGGSMELEVRYDSTAEPQFNFLVEELLQGGPDGLFLITGPLNTALIIQQLYKRNVQLPFIGSEWAEDQELIDQGGPLVEQLYISNLYTTDTTNEEYQTFVENYIERFKAVPTGWAAMGYESAMILAHALENKKRTQYLKEVLLSTTFEGLQEEISFNGNGDVDRNIYIHTVRDDTFVTVEPQK